MSYVYCGAEDTSAHTAHGAQQAWVTNMQVASSKSFFKLSWLARLNPPPPPKFPCLYLPSPAGQSVCVPFPTWSQPQDCYELGASVL